MHAGWAIALGAGLLLYARTWAGRVAGLVYPTAVLLTIVVTGNHFVFDAIAGALVIAVGFAATAPVRVRFAEPAYATASTRRD